MKKITISLNEHQHKAFVDRADGLELSKYALLKQIALGYLYDDAPSNSDDVARLYAKKVKALKHQQKWALTAIFVLSLYFVASLTYILLF